MKYFVLLTLLGCAQFVTAPAPVSEKEMVAIPKAVPEMTPQPPQPAEAFVLPKLSDKLRQWCERTDREFVRYNWGKSRCEEFQWNHVRQSAQGHPIPWVVFGEENDLEKKNVTLIMCGVHGDEITPVKFCYDILYDLRDFHWDFSQRVVVIAPLVSPDSFFVPRPTRTNGRGVDVNRNFPTQDWNKDALRLWSQKYGRDKRRYPGKKPMSEAETIFQVNLIKRYRPSKIISVHAPLIMLDYDGPDIDHRETHAAKDLLLTMSEKAAGYKVSNYPHFPGSLGNWAGNDLGIPTYTLELPNSDPHQSQRYWRQFREAIHHAIEHPISIEEKDKTL